MFRKRGDNCIKVYYLLLKYLSTVSTFASMRLFSYSERTVVLLTKFINLFSWIARYYIYARPPKNTPRVLGGMPQGLLVQARSDVVTEKGDYDYLQKVQLQN